MANGFRVQIIVNDEAGEPIGDDARVTFIPAPLPAGAHYPFEDLPGNYGYTSTRARYVSTSRYTTTGEYDLIISKAGLRTVYQKIDVAKAQNEYGYSMTFPDADMLIVNGKVTQTVKTPWQDSSVVEIIPTGLAKEGASISVVTFTITVVMHRFNKTAIFCGVHYHDSGTPWRSYFQTRWDQLIQSTWNHTSYKYIDGGTVVAFFSCEEQTIYYYIKSKNNKYLEVYKESKPDRLSHFTPGQTWPLPKERPMTNDNSISIIELYHHLSNETAKTVREVSIFSHAWGIGPVIYSTFEDDAHHSNPDERDPNDFDGRAKDFNSNRVYADWPHLAEVMADSGQWCIWGCSNSPLMRGAMAGANNNRGHNRPREEYFDGPFEHWDNDGNISHCRHHTNQDTCYYHIASELLGIGYAGALAARLNANPSLQVWAAVPGSWAAYNQRTFWVSWQDTDETRVYFENEPHIKDHFHPNAAGYVNFIPYQHLAAPAAPLPITEYFVLEEFTAYFNISFYKMNPYDAKTYTQSSRQPVVNSPQPVSDAGTAYRNPAFKDRSGHVHVVSDGAKNEWRYLVLNGSPNTVEVIELVQTSPGNWAIP